MGAPIAIQWSDDAYDEDNYDDVEDEYKFYDCIGPIKQKLKKNKLIHCCNLIDRQEDSKEEVRNVTRIFTETYNQFKKEMIKKFGTTFPRKRRFVTFIDRRKYITKYTGKPPDIKIKYEKRKKTEKDEVVYVLCSVQCMLYYVI